MHHINKFSAARMFYGWIARRLIILIIKIISLLIFISWEFIKFVIKLFLEIKKDHIQIILFLLN